MKGRKKKKLNAVEREKKKKVKRKKHVSARFKCGILPTTPECGGAREIQFVPVATTPPRGISPPGNSNIYVSLPLKE